MKDSIGWRLGELRHRLRLSVSKFAEMLDLHRNTLINYEADSHVPDLTLAQKLQKAGLDWSYVVTGEPLEIVALEAIDWPLVNDIWQHIDEHTRGRKAKVTVQQRVAIIKLVYRSSIAQRKMSTAAAESGMRLIA